MTKQFIIFDTEWASWKGFIENFQENIKKIEMVQIAAVKVNLHDLSVAEEFSVYIKPQITPNLTQYFIDLTGITDELLDEKGTSFEHAYKQFKNFVGDLICYSHGPATDINDIADGHVMNANLELYNIFDNNKPNYRNIAPWILNTYKEKGINITYQNSGAIAKNLGLGDELKHLGLDEHNAIYDVYSILLGLRHLGLKELP